MTEYQELPIFDDSGINLADPNDALGHKTTYISRVQARALQRYLGAGSGNALDIGCGYGRMTDAVASLGYLVTGVDPSERVLKVAADRRPEFTWQVGQLPDLPFPDRSFDLVCLFNVARALHLMNIADICRSVPRLVKPGGKLVVIDNLRRGDERYLPEEWFDETFAQDGMHLSRKVPIRSSRWLIIYMIRYGLIPARWLDAIANWELRRMARKVRVPRFSYYNYLFVYEKQ